MNIFVKNFSLNASISLLVASIFYGIFAGSLFAGGYYGERENLINQSIKRNISHPYFFKKDEKRYKTLFAKVIEYPIETGKNFAINRYNSGKFDNIITEYQNDRK